MQPRSSFEEGFVHIHYKALTRSSPQLGYSHRCGMRFQMVYKTIVAIRDMKKSLFVFEWSGDSEATGRFPSVQGRATLSL